MAPDIGAKLVMPDLNDYVKRVVMVPMRDGVKLYTVIVVPKAQQRPSCSARPTMRRGVPARGQSQHLATLPQGDDTLVENGYIRVFRTCAASMARKATT
jgi:predicted acyl esterase